jgi:predicted dehydrogenase
MTRLGLIGLGAWGRRYERTIARRSDCRIDAFVTRTGAASVPGASRCATWHDVLDRVTRGDLDAVIAATTPSNQAEIAAAAVAQGVPVLVEKPLGACRAAADKVRQCFDTSAHKAPIVVDYVHLFAPAYRALKGLVDLAGGSTSVAAIVSNGSNRGPFRSWPPLLDYGPHDVALCLDLLGYNAEFRLAGVTPIRAGAEGELIEARFQLGAASILMTVGNGAETKVRRFAVTLATRRTLVYDDCQPHPTKLVDEGAAVRVDETAPLDATLTYFLLQQRLWAHEGPTGGEGARWLELSVRIAEILDAIGQASAGLR